MHGITAFNDAKRFGKTKHFNYYNKKPDIFQTINAVKRKYLETQGCES